MGEVTRPIISIMLVLCAVFVPVAFVSGLTGQFYRQFGITIAASTIISTFNSLTLSPALAALLLKPQERAAGLVSARHQPGVRAVLRAVQSRVRACLGALWPWCPPRSTALRGCRADGVRRAAGRHLGHVSASCPAASFPRQDKQYLIGIVQLARCGLARPHRKGRAADLRDSPRHTPGVDHVIGFSGLSVQGFVNLSNAAVCFFPLKPFDERKTKDLSAAARSPARSTKNSARFKDAVIFAVPPPPVQGLGTTGGFKLYHSGSRGARLRRARARDRRSPEQGAATARAQSLRHLHDVPEQRPAAVCGRRSREGEAPGRAAVERVRHAAGISRARCTSTTSTASAAPTAYMRRPRPQFRASAGRHREFENAQRQRRRWCRWGRLPTCASKPGPDRVSHYNVYLAADINGQGAPGVSSGQATAAMERVLQ